MKTILLGEDSRFLRLANERAVVRAGYRVATAADGEEALRLARENVPDLILFDMLLPSKVGGPEVLRSLRTTPLTTQVPLFVPSSLPQSNDARLRKHGATAYLDKSTLALDQHSESPINIVKRVLHEQEVAEGDTGCPVLDLQTLTVDNEI